MRPCVGPQFYGLDTPYGAAPEPPCSHPALKGWDMCLYHGAREIVAKLAPEFSVTISEPEPLDLRRALEPEASV